MQKIYLLRHGETDWNAEGRLQGHSDVPLNDQGRDQAKRIIPILQDIDFDRCYTSDLSRAAETAILALQKKGITPIKEPRLRERNFGFMNGLLAEDIDHLKKTAPHRFITLDATGRQIAEDAESEPDFTARIRSFVKDIEDGADRSILIVTHGGVIRHFIRLLTPGQFIFQPVNCGLYLFTRGVDGFYTFDKVHHHEEQ